MERGGIVLLSKHLEVKKFSGFQVYSRVLSSYIVGVAFVNHELRFAVMYLLWMRDTE